MSAPVTPRHVDVDVDVDVDVVDRLAGIRPGSRLDDVRRRRPIAREQTQHAYELLFGPGAGGLFSRAERLAVATFVTALHGETRIADHYAALLAEVEPEWVDPLRAEADRAAGRGPWGTYREPGLADESVPGPAYVAAPGIHDRLGGRLAGALTHAHLLVLHPRDASPEALASLAAAGWSRSGIVTLSQAVAFLTYQIRLVHGLRQLAIEGDS
ncbi:CMD domain protein [Raineyella fluvialis]|uniref:CMD domain protein n=1 Tax=Raineyella fluvialis TaxID=2662261 RepID=A0A5Q2F7Q1_9ACTN|nr:CMD domain protein [Raineyella fluvialis]QGF22481.1 CMD domain protein [Raineyella fluvialis]